MELRLPLRCLSRLFRPKKFFFGSVCRSCRAHLCLAVSFLFAVLQMPGRTPPRGARCYGDFLVGRRGCHWDSGPPAADKSGRHALLLCTTVWFGSPPLMSSSLLLARSLQLRARPTVSHSAPARSAGLALGGRASQRFPSCARSATDASDTPIFVKVLRRLFFIGNFLFF